MNIVLKEKEIYKELVFINNETYKSDDLTEKRITNIFGSFSRILRGRKGLDKIKKEKELKKLCNFVKDNVINELINNHGILKSESKFNKWHEKQINNLIKTCPITWTKNNGKRLTVGMAQKIINLTCKDLWALDYIPEKKSRFLHIILDQSTIEVIKRYVKEVKPWTMVKCYEEYMEYQKLFKIMCLNPMVLENIIWHTFSKQTSQKKPNAR